MGIFLMYMYRPEIAIHKNHRYERKEVETVLCKCDCFVPRKDFTHVLARNEAISLPRVTSLVKFLG
jgi:hypothetical protein